MRLLFRAIVHPLLDVQADMQAPVIHIKRIAVLPDLQAFVLAAKLEAEPEFFRVVNAGLVFVKNIVKASTVCHKAKHSENVIVFLPCIAHPGTEIIIVVHPTQAESFRMLPIPDHHGVAPLAPSVTDCKHAHGIL